MSPLQPGVSRLTRLDEDTVARAIRLLSRRDRVLASAIRRAGPFQLRRRTNRYQALLRAIVAQQISTRAAQSIWARLELAAGDASLKPDAVHQLDDATLRGAGLSPQKLGYVRDLTNRVVTGELRLASLHRLPDDEVITRLVAVKGIGVWTAQMFLMFSLGRPDVLPTGDLGIQSAIRSLYDMSTLPSPKEIEVLAQPWRPYATVACWYLWRHVEWLSEQKKLRPQATAPVSLTPPPTAAEAPPCSSQTTAEEFW